MKKYEITEEEVEDLYSLCRFVVSQAKQEKDPQYPHLVDMANRMGVKLLCLLLDTNKNIL